jgi:hypothetical protein
MGNSAPRLRQGIYNTIVVDKFRGAAYFGGKRQLARELPEHICWDHPGDHEFLMERAKWKLAS